MPFDAVFLSAVTAELREKLVGVPRIVEAEKCLISAVIILNRNIVEFFHIVIGIFFPIFPILFDCRSGRTETAVIFGEQIFQFCIRMNCDTGSNIALRTGCRP